MGRPQQLSSLDAAFLALESERVPFVIGSVLRFDRRIDLARLRAYVDAALDGLPRYRQRLARVPLLGYRTWIDDETFAIERHVHAVPTAGARDVMQVAAELLSRGLPRDHPPWQLWVMDIGGEQSAIIAIVHHSLVDGVAGVQLLQHLLRGAPDENLPARHGGSRGRRPTGYQMVAAEIRRRAQSLREIGKGFSVPPAHLGRAIAGLLWQGLHPASDIGLNPRRTGRERTIATCALDLASVKQVRTAFGVTVNDVVLAVTAGALRGFLLRRGTDLSDSHDVRAMVPVSTLRRGESATSGNRVALLLAPLPVDEPDPVRRLRRVATATRALKENSGQREAGELMVRLSDATIPALLSGVLRLALSRRAFNVVITNIPGPPFTLYLAIIPDLRPLARDLVASFDELMNSARPDAEGCPLAGTRFA
jgi:WS/DGAT/MGAT family acyltransferase